MKRADALQAITTLLFEAWDPIGVRPLGGPPDEYRSYAPTILRMLDHGSSARDLALHLSRLARDSIGLTAVDEDLHFNGAEALIRLRASGYRVASPRT